MQVGCEGPGWQDGQLGVCLGSTKKTTKASKWGDITGSHICIRKRTLILIIKFGLEVERSESYKASKFESLQKCGWDEKE